MKIYSGKGLGDFYYQIIRDITNHGREVTVRGQRRLELKGPVVLEYTQPGACWMQIPGRKFNPFFALAEVFWILGGMGNVEWIAYYNSKIKEIAADEGQEDFHGAYGLRLRKWAYAIPHKSGPDYEYGVLDQTQHVVRKLKADPFSTQAVMSLWDPVRDNLDRSKDYPCNNWVGYSLRDGSLDQSVVIRSNDIVLGQPHNAVQFMHLQAYVAGLLGARIGKLTYFVQNLHYYLDIYTPTLGNLIKLAFGPQDGAEIGPGAIACPDFGPFGDAELQSGLTHADCILEEAAEGFLHGKTFSGGYIDATLPKMLWLFALAKEGQDISGNWVLPEPFPWLIEDFWHDSKLPRAQDFLARV